MSATNTVPTDERVSVEDGKYTVVMQSDGGLRALRYGEPWRDLTGDKFIYCLATELRDARQDRDEVLEALRELEWACSGVEYMEAEYADKLKLARDVIAKATGSAA